MLAEISIQKQPMYNKKKARFLLLFTCGTRRAQNGNGAEDEEAAQVEPEKVTNLLALRDALYSKVCTRSLAT